MEISYLCNRTTRSIDSIMKIYTPLLLLLFVLAACTGKKQTEAERPSIVVSIEPVRFFAEAIAGDKCDVTSMVPDGVSPETYDPTPQQLIALGKSRAFLRIGYIGYELVWADKLQQNAPSVPFFDVSKGIGLITEEEPGHHHHHPAGVEPHVWSSPRNANIIADNICQSLCEVLPADSSFFKQRLDSLKEEIGRTEKEISSCLADGSRAFLIYHPALSYFARDYGLHQISIEKGGKEPSPAYLQALIDQCRREQVKIIFVQREFDVRNAEIIAKELGVKVVTINPLSYQWKEEMIRIAKALGDKEEP